MNPTFRQQPEPVSTGRPAIPLRCILELFALLILLSGCRTMDPIQDGPNGEYIHARSGVVYPRNLGAFQRNGYHLYDKKGDDISVAYDLVSWTDRIVATIYTYPAPSFVSVGSSEDVVSEVRRKLFSLSATNEITGVLDYHQPAELIGQTSQSNRIGNPGIPGMHANFRYMEVLGDQPQRVQSELYLYQKGDWIIKYRITYPENIRDKARKLIRTLMDDHVVVQEQATSFSTTRDRRNI